ncbi:MAG: ATP-binding protein, partial [Myxococcaceae bacterium]|nr:ATP-binding protein [Myxococcaceae bacterium]
ICHEHVGPAREWLPEEQAFGFSVAQLVSIRLEMEERLKAEQALRESEARFSVLASSASDYSLVLLDAQGRVQIGSGRLRGFHSEEFRGRHVSAFFTPDDVARGRPKRALQRALKHGRYREEGWLVRADGSRYWASMDIVPLWTETGELSGFASVMHDLTERKLAEEKQQLLDEAKRSEREQRLLYTTSAALGSSLKVEHNLARVAQLVVPMLADGCFTLLMDAPETDGALRSVAIASVDAAGEGLLEQLASTLGRETSWGPRFRNVMRGATPRMFHSGGASPPAGFVDDPAGEWLLRALGVHSVMVTPLRTHRKTIGVMTFVRFRSKARFLKRDLRVAEELARRAAYAVESAHLYQLAQQSISLRDEFLSIASHELRTPLSAVRLNLEGLQRLVSRRHAEGSGEDVQRKLESATRQVTRMARLIDDLLEVSRLSIGKLELHPAELDLGKLVDAVAELFRDEAARTHTPLHVDTAAHVVGRWDPLRLEQVIINLVSNALKFGAGKPLELAVREQGEMACLIVRDHGIGISAKDVARIFGRYERAVSSRHFGGLGLGLYISQKLVEAQGGSIEVESRIGEGTTFLVHLPRWSLGDAASREAGEPLTSEAHEHP